MAQEAGEDGGSVPAELRGRGSCPLHTAAQVLHSLPACIQADHMQAEMESKKKKALEAEEELAALRAEKENRAPEMQLVGGMTIGITLQQTRTAWQSRGRERTGVHPRCSWWMGRNFVVRLQAANDSTPQQATTGDSR